MKRVQFDLRSQREASPEAGTRDGRTYDIETQIATTIVSISGDFDQSSSSVFSIVAELSTQPLERLIISLEHCTYCASSALTMLVRAHKMMKHGSLLVVIPEHSQCRRVFEITGLIKLLQIVPTLESAIRYEPVAAQRVDRPGATLGSRRGA